MIHNRFSDFVVKEFKHIIRDPRTLLIVILMPVLQLIIFGYVVSNEISDARIAIYDKSNDYLSQQLTQKLAASGYFLPVRTIHNDSEINEAFKSGDVKLVIVYESNFADNFIRFNRANVQIITDASEPNTASILANYAQAVIGSFTNEQNNNGLTASKLEIRTRMLYNSELKAVYMFVPGTMVLILMLITAMMTSISITREKELGTMEILLVSPLRPSQIIFGKVLPYVGLAFFNTIVILLMGYTVFGLPLRGSLLLLLTVCFIFILLALSLGILISTLSKTQAIAMFMSMFALMLPTILLSGFIFPIDNMPKALQWLSLIMPPRWFLAAIKTLMIKGEGFAYVWKEVTIMVGMIVFFLMLSIKKFKVRLE
ncbi:MAG: ABC transporter permease [Bacteroidales bacterium]